MNEIIVKGKNLQEAIRLASKKLNRSSSRLDIEIIDHGKSGFLGFGERQVIINAKIKEDDLDALDTLLSLAMENVGEREVLGAEAKIEKKKNSKMAEGLQSWVCFQNGHFKIHHPDNAPYPVVVPNDWIKLKINGVETKKETPVSCGDKLEVEVINSEEQGKWYLEISEDGLSVKLHLKPTIMTERLLSNIAPAKELHLKPLKYKTYTSPLSVDQLHQELIKKNVTYGIDWKACTSLDDIKCETDIVIAKGEPPKSGKDAVVEILFSTQKKQKKSFDEGHVTDFKEIFQFTSVNAGEVLARKVPSVPGQPGISVTEDIIFPPDPKDVELLSGPGTIIDEEGNKVIAIAQGRPVIHENNSKAWVEILPSMVHQGDVDIHSGNLSFLGDILISGNVTDGMAVNAAGAVMIDGLMSQAFVQASNSILIKGNVLASVVNAGGTSAFLQGLLPLIQNLSSQLGELLSSVNQVIEQVRPEKDGFLGPLLRALLAKKFPEVSQNVMLLRNEVFKLPNKLKPQGLEECVTLLEYYLVKSPLTIKDTQQMNNMLKEVVVWKDVFESYEATKADVVSSYTLNSCIMATGDVRIAGTGSYNSKIHAGGKVKIHGVFRGGELYAGSDVYVRELGSNAGIPSRICTAESSVVTIGKAFENTTVTIGKVKHEFFRTEKRLKLALDKDEKSMIVISA